MTAKALNGLWEYLQTLSLTQNNRKWLAARLMEPRSKDDAPKECRSNPYDVSPSGDEFWASQKNVDKLNEVVSKMETEQMEFVKVSSVADFQKLISL